jgi:hypothetical protein
MSGRKPPWATLLVGLVVVAGLPLAGHWARRHRAEGCALDGAAVNPAYRVEVVDASGHPHAFCCLRCAQIWLEDKPDPRAVTVTDEASGEPIDAAAAWFVRSSVVTMPTTGNRVHAFRTRADAERHADQFWGVVLSGSERPFAP